MGSRGFFSAFWLKKLLTLVVVVVGAVSFVENSAALDSTAENQAFNVLNRLLTFLWKTQNPPFFNTLRGIPHVEN